MSSHDVGTLVLVLRLFQISSKASGFPVLPWSPQPRPTDYPASPQQQRGSRVFGASPRPFPVTGEPGISPLHFAFPPASSPIPYSSSKRDNTILHRLSWTPPSDNHEPDLGLHRETPHVLPDSRPCPPRTPSLYFPRTWAAQHKTCDSSPPSQHHDSVAPKRTSTVVAT